MEFNLPENNVTVFVSGTEEVLRIDSKGMTYKGQRIEDVGEAHKAFLEAMIRIKEVNNAI